MFLLEERLLVRDVVDMLRWEVDTDDDAQDAPVSRSEDDTGFDDKISFVVKNEEWWVNAGLCLLISADFWNIKIHHIERR